LERQQASLGNHQIHQTKQAEELRGVLGQSTVAQLAVPEEILDH
jgi:hypothetical protein